MEAIESRRKETLVLWLHRALSPVTLLTLFHWLRILRLQEHEPVLADIEPVELNYGSVYSVAIKNTKNEWVWICLFQQKYLLNMQRLCTFLQVHQHKFTGGRSPMIKMGKDSCFE